MSKSSKLSSMEDVGKPRNRTTSNLDGKIRRFLVRGAPIVRGREKHRTINRQHGLSADHATTLLGRTIQLVEMGEAGCARYASGERLGPPTFPLFTDFCMVITVTRPTPSLTRNTKSMYPILKRLTSPASTV